MKFIRFVAIVLCLSMFGEGSKAATTLLPNGKQCFAGVNGAYSSGSINFFIPNTSVPKSTWQDPLQASLNTQPIQLDANGCAVIYGIGQYRQQLFDGPVVGGVTTGNLIWDQLTTDTSAFNSVFWAGIAGGTPNVITITDPGFNGTDGSVVQFIALATNTGSATLNPSGFGNVLIQKSTTAGPVSLSGGEIVAGNLISAVYSSSSNTFQLLNAVIQSASGASAPLCGATNLKITNGATPNSVIAVTADQLVMLTASGIVQSRNNVSLSINITTGTTTSTANGMDGESPGTSAWVNVYAIDNGAAPAGLGALSATSPNLPSGYTFKCRLGAMRVNGSGNLLTTIQRGNRSQYIVTSAGTVTNLIQVTAPTSAGTYISTAWGSVFPPTSSSLEGTLTVIASTVADLAPNANYGVSASTTNPPPCSATQPAATNVGLQCSLIPETSNIFFSSNSTGNFFWGSGWNDSVNAN